MSFCFPCQLWIAAACGYTESCERKVSVRLKLMELFSPVEKCLISKTVGNAMASSEDFFLQREKSEGKERLGLVRFAGILTVTRRLIGERLRTTTCGC